MVRNCVGNCGRSYYHTVFHCIPAGRGWTRQSILWVFYRLLRLLCRAIDSWPWFPPSAAILMVDSWTLNTIDHHQFLTTSHREWSSTIVIYCCIHREPSLWLKQCISMRVILIIETVFVAFINSKHCCNMNRSSTIISHCYACDSSWALV